MRSGIPDTPLAFTLLWIWLGIATAAIVGYRAFLWWRRRHPRQIPKAERPFAKQLQTRFNKHRSGCLPSKSLKRERRGAPHESLSRRETGHSTASVGSQENVSYGCSAATANGIQMDQKGVPGLTSAKRQSRGRVGWRTRPVATCHRCSRDPGQPEGADPR